MHKWDELNNNEHILRLLPFEKSITNGAENDNQSLAILMRCERASPVREDGGRGRDASEETPKECK